MAIDFGMRKAPPASPTLEVAALGGESATKALILERNALRLQVATLTQERDYARASIGAFNVALAQIDGLIRGVCDEARKAVDTNTPTQEIAQRFATEAPPPPSNGEPPSTEPRPRQKRTPLPDPTQDMRPSTLMERMTA